MARGFLRCSPAVLDGVRYLLPTGLMVVGSASSEDDGVICLIIEGDELVNGASYTVHVQDSGNCRIATVKPVGGEAEA